MTIIQAIILGLIQGLTEFIPVSSSGHLLLLPEFFGWQEQPTSFDIVLHGGTLLALIIYFYPKLKKLVKGILNREWEQIKLGKKILLGAIPAGALGILISIVDYMTNDAVDNFLKTNLLVIIMIIGIGVLLIISDIIYKNNKKEIKEIGLKETFIIGIGQCLSLLRGTSRSGITILTGLTQKLSRKEAAEFSFLMSIPLIFSAFCYQVFKFILENNMNIEITNLMAGFLAAFISGLIAIKFMLRFLKKQGLSIFGMYRIILGIVVIIILI